MDSCILNKKGVSILEVSVVVVIVCMLISSVIANGKPRVDKANIEKTVNEMMSIAQASLDYYNSQSYWPVVPSDLAPTYMNGAVTSSPYGGKYIIKGQTNDQNNSVTVSTTVPLGLVQNYYQGTLLEISPGVSQDTIRITQQLPNKFSGRLEYEKIYRYQQ